MIGCAGCRAICIGVAALRAQGLHQEGPFIDKFDHLDGRAIPDALLVVGESPDSRYSLLHEDLDLANALSSGRDGNVNAPDLVESVAVVHGAVGPEAVEPAHHEDKKGEGDRANNSSGNQGDREAVSEVKDGGPGPAKPGEEGADAADGKHSGSSSGSGVEVEIRKIKGSTKENDDHLNEQDKAGGQTDRHKGLHPFGFQVEPPFKHVHSLGVVRLASKPKNVLGFISKWDGGERAITDLLLFCNRDLPEAERLLVNGLKPHEKRLDQVSRAGDTGLRRGGSDAKSRPSRVGFQSAGRFSQFSWEAGRSEGTP